MNVSDPSARTNLQADAIRAGMLLQNLGSLLLELGRTTMMLRTGQSPVSFTNGFYIILIFRVQTFSESGLCLSCPVRGCN